jgi:hypothetical protein
MKQITLIIVTVLTSWSVYCQDIIGDWHGTLKVPGMELGLVFHITKTEVGYSTTMDVPAQNAKGIQATMTSFENSVLYFKVAQMGIEYKGTLNPENSIKGAFNQSGQSFPLVLTEGVQEVLLRPQEPIKPYPYYSEEVKFSSDNGKVELAGTLTLPSKSGNFPIAILISGSGPQNRDEEFMLHKPFLVLADHLTRSGIGVLRYDDRGYAESTGDHGSATSLDFAKDVQSAIDYMKSRNEINKNHIGLIGHSEGGLIAPLVASKSKDVDFIVLLAGPGLSGDKILLKQQAMMGKLAGRSDSLTQIVIENTKAAYDIVRKNDNDKLLRIELVEYVKQKLEADSNGNETRSLSNEEIINKEVNQLMQPWMKYFLRYDPVTSLKKVQCPVLAINGEKDVQVTPDNLAIISNALKKGGNNNITIKEFPNLNHLFQECKTGAMSEYATIEQTFAPFVLQEVSDWILKEVSD